MLEAVVEDDCRDGEALDGQARGVVTVPAHHHRHSGQPARQQKRLIACILGVEPDRAGVGDNLHTAALPPVAAAHDRGPMAEVGQRLDRPLHGGRLARPSNRQIAHRDDGAR